MTVLGTIAYFIVLTGAVLSLRQFKVTTWLPDDDGIVWNTAIEKRMSAGSKLESKPTLEVKNTTDILRPQIITNSEA